MDRRSTKTAPWSNARLTAAVAASRPDRHLAAIDQPLRDEIELISTTGTRHDVPGGETLVRRGMPMGEVHLIHDGAAAVLGAHKGRRPILSFAVRGEFCGAIPALLRVPAPWDVVTVVGSSVITVPTAHFTAAVRERWIERWSIRTLSWLADIGARIADLDEPGLAGQVSALLLRQRGELAVDDYCGAFADLLDVDDDAVRRVLAELDELDGRDAVRVAGSHVGTAREPVRSRRRGLMMARLPSPK